MRRSRSTFNLLLMLLVTSLPLALLAWVLMTSDRPASSDNAVHVKLQIDGAKERVELHRHDDGTLQFVLEPGRAGQETLSPDELAERLYRQESSRDLRGITYRLLNISTPIGFIWVSVGLLGQLLFTGRMLVQWLASEKRRESVVPPIFWWMSLIGAMMLLIYFLWRRDIVGVLGQSFGLIVYVRNLYFILAASAGVSVMNDPASESELGDSGETSGAGIQ